MYYCNAAGAAAIEGDIQEALFLSYVLRATYRYRLRLAKLKIGARSGNQLSFNTPTVPQLQVICEAILLYLY